MWCIVCLLLFFVWCVCVCVRARAPVCVSVMTVSVYWVCVWARVRTFFCLFFVLFLCSLLFFFFCLLFICFVSWLLVHTHVCQGRKRGEATRRLPPSSKQAATTTATDEWTSFRCPQGILTSVLESLKLYKYIKSHTVPKQRARD